MTVRIVTDSTADLPAVIVKKYNITVVPLNIHFGEEVLKDGVEIWSEEFYHRLNNDPLLPNTSQPAPGEFFQVYLELAQTGEPVVSIHISSELSGTAGSAEIAAAMLGEASRIKVVDSRSVSMGLGLIVIQAAQMAQLGAGPEEILQRIRVCQERLRVLFTVNNLEFLARTGRIGKATEFVGSLLNIKPVLGIKDGLIVPLERLRGNYQKISARMVELLREEFADRPLWLSILHTDLPEIGNYLMAEVKSKLQVIECFPAIVGPVVGSHSGPSTYGIMALPVDELS